METPGAVPQRPYLDIGRVGVYDEVGYALLAAPPGSCPDKREEDVGVTRVRSPDLLAGNDVLIAVAAAGCAQARQVRASVRFGIPLGPYLVTAEHGGEPPLLLLLGAVLNDRGRGDVQAGAERARHARAGRLFVVNQLLGQ